MLFDYWIGYWDKEDWEKACEEYKKETVPLKTYDDYTKFVDVSIELDWPTRKTGCSVTRNKIHK